jgi:hypothetical protein
MSPVTASGRAVRKRTAIYESGQPADEPKPATFGYFIAGDLLERCRAKMDFGG